MNTKIVIFTIVSLILVIPSVSAQETNIAEKANQELVKVIISDEGDIHVKHIVSSSNSPKQVKLIDGAVQNLMINDEKGEEQLLTIIGDNDAVMISPSDNDSIIEYDLDNVLSQKDNVWTWDFRYLETTSFIFNLI
jgi:competence protein ComGC